MFGSRRKRAVRAAVDNISHWVEEYQRAHGVPTGFWQNDYIVGFIGRLIGCHMHAASDGKLSAGAKWRGMVAAFAELSGLNGKEIARQYTDLVVSHNSEFRLAADRATAFYSYMAEGLEEQDTYPELVAIKAQWEEEGLGDDREVIANKLFQTWFVDVVRPQLS